MENNQFFEQFDEIYEKREQYNMSWAFKDAQDKLNEYKKEVVDNKLKKACGSCKKLSRMYEIFKSKNLLELKKQKMISSIFSNAYNLVSILEILLSVILVLVISELSHGDLIAHGTKMFSVWVVLVFAFIKVFLEHLILRPRIEMLGWKMYKNSVDTLRGLSSDIREQISYDYETV